MVDQVIQVVTTTNTRHEADAIARELVRQRLAACVQVLGPIASTYYWEDKLEEGLEEWMCVIKSLRTNFSAVEKAIRQLHSYEVPEIMAVPAVEVSRDYLAWLISELHPRGGK